MHKQSGIAEIVILTLIVAIAGLVNGGIQSHLVDKRADERQAHHEQVLQDARIDALQRENAELKQANP